MFGVETDSMPGEKYCSSEFVFCWHTAAVRFKDCEPTREVSNAAMAESTW